MRPIERDDLPRFVEWFSDPEVRRHLAVWLPFSLAQEERWFEKHLEQLERQESVVLAIETEEGVHIGNTGLHQIDWKNRSATLGIAIGEKAYWNQGYGSDAIRTLLKLAFREMSMHRIQLRVDTDNSRAVRCYEKAGFRKEGTLREVVFREGAWFIFAFQGAKTPLHFCGCEDAPVIENQVRNGQKGTPEANWERKWANFVVVSCRLPSAVRRICKGVFQRW